MPPVVAADSAPHWDPLDLLTVAQVADLIKQHPRSVRRHIAAGRITAVYLGSSVRVPRAALEDFIRSGGEVTAK